MCYQNCKYERWGGECRIARPYPPDAACVIMDREIEEYEDSLEAGEIVVDPPGISMEAVARMAGFTAAANKFIK